MMLLAFEESEITHFYVLWSSTHDSCRKKKIEESLAVFLFLLTIRKTLSLHSDANCREKQRKFKVF